MIRSAQLRVYMPRARLGTFDPHYGHPRNVVRVSDEFLWIEPTTDDALSVVWNGEEYVCPRYPRLRMLEGVLTFRDEYPGSGLASELAVRWASQELKRIRASEPSARSYIQSAPWHVPLRWFACFDGDARELYDTPDGPSVRYRTTVHEATIRTSRAVEILENAGFDDALVEDVRELQRWLSEFSGDGMLELDYHTVAGLFDAGTLAFDESCAEVNRSLTALEHLDYEEAGLAYADVATRWAPAVALAYVN